MSVDPQVIAVEVAYALPHTQCIVALKVESGTTALDAVRQSGIEKMFSEIDLSSATMGIFSRVLDGKSVPLPQDYVLMAGDRVEIYRPLQLDPKQVRLLRAAKTRKARVVTQNKR